MALTVKVLSYKDQPSTKLLSASFGQQGGTLGRAEENHFVLPDPDKYISRKHALISYENGFYYLKDTSTAGTFMTNKNQHVHHNTVQLADGDTLRIGDYDLIVSIRSDQDVDAPSAPAVAQGEDPFGFGFGQDKGPTDESDIRDRSGQDPAVSPSENDIFGPIPEPAAPRGNNYEAAIDGSFVPPEVVASPGQTLEIPDDIDDFFNESDRPEKPFAAVEPTGVPTPGRNRSQAIPDDFFTEPQQTDDSDDIDTARDRRDVQVDSAKPAGRPTRARVVEGTESTQPDPHEAYNELWRVFLKAAAIEDASLSDREDIAELMRTVGEVFRVLIDGLMTILRGRTELKAQFRVPVTILRPAENNPLKFSPDVDEALKLLLTKNHRGFIDAVDAVREGYDDIMNHQLAITAGIQASLMQVLERFAPQKFTKQYEEGLVFRKKAKCWDAYSQAYREIAKEALEDFFGDEFARAYEEQMSKLRATYNKRNQR